MTLSFMKMSAEEIFENSDNEDEIFQGFSEGEIIPFMELSNQVPTGVGFGIPTNSFLDPDPPFEAHRRRNVDSRRSVLEGPAEPFNEDLPADHSYLGQNLSEVSGRMIYTELRSVKIPIISGHFGPLLPGQTFPLCIRDEERIDLIRKIIQGEHTFGCLSQSQPNDEKYLYGTTAEIYEYSDERERIRMKAKGRQRFKLLKGEYGNERPSIRMAEVLILPEIKLTHPLNALNSPSISALRYVGKDAYRKAQADLTVFPKWVYDMYDPEKLVERADKLTFLKQGLRSEKGKQNVMPRDPTELSFWIASNLDSGKRLKMLKINSPIPRLRWLLSFLSMYQQYICGNCDTTIGNQSDIFAMSIEGAQSTYVNSEGYHHDTVTLLHAENILPITAPSTHFSWFPGYAWSIAVCSRCQKHLGWQFTASELKLKPTKFWGLTRSSLETRIGPGQADEDSDIPL